MNDLTLSLIQPDLKWQDANANRDLLEQFLEATVEQTDLIVLPEMFTSAYTVDSSAIAEPWPGETVDWMRTMAATWDAAICGSIAASVGGDRVNRFVFVTPEGKVRHYDKRHLFRMLGEHNRYVSGGKRIIIEWRGWRLMPQICYDLRFPVWSRNTPDLAYDLLLYAANWPAARNAHWQTLLQARAIENLACVAGVNRVGRDGNDIDYIGHSMVIDATGEILLDAGEAIGGYTVTLSGKALQEYRESFPAHKDADSFLLSSSMAE